MTVLHRTTKAGLGRAYVAGILHALENSAHIVIQMDADLSHPAAAVPTMLDVLATKEAAYRGHVGGWSGALSGRSRRS